MTTEKVKRKLTAILSADVKGYSRLMGADEVGTIRILQTYRGVISDLIQKKGGRVVDSPGDNVLAEFASVVDALESAVEIQRELKVRNADRSESRRMEFRIGINLGDVIEEGERIYGDGVNISARIEGLADGGGICISGTAFDHVGKRLPLGYEFMGEQAVKNIEKPVRVYRVLMEPEQAGKVIGEREGKGRRWRWAAVAAVVLVAGALALWNFYLRPPPIEPASKEKMAFPLPDKPSIAVLPFTNMSDDPKQEFFSDGISEEIINALCKVPQVFVIARNSSFTYKGKPVKIQQVAQDLGVNYVLEGSVRRNENRIRITAQLIDALTGRHVFSERYDRDLKEIFATQDEIAIKVLTALRVALTDGEIARLQGRGVSNIDAFFKLLEAHTLTQSMNKESSARARRLAEEALLIEPESSRAYFLLASTHFIDFWVGPPRSPAESIAQGIAMAQKTIEMDPNNAAAYSLLGMLYVTKAEYDKAVEVAERGASMDPNSVTAVYLYGSTLMHASRHEEAIPVLEKAIRLSPLNPPLQCLSNLASCYANRGRYDEAVKLLKRVLQEQPNQYLANISLTSVYAQMDRIEDARAQAAQVLRINPKFSLESLAKTWRNKDPAITERSVNALRKAGLPVKPPLPFPDKPSIAVLPFQNMTGDPQQEYFGDGMADQLITGLSQSPDIYVTSRTSSFTYKGKSVTAQQIADQLGVRYLLEGGFQRNADRVRINVQIIDGQNGNHLWAQRYDSKFEDLFALQDQITMEAMEFLNVKFMAGFSGTTLSASLKHYRPSNLKAYESYTKGVYHFHRRTPKDSIAARQLFEETINLDPEFAVAYSSLGLAYLDEVWFRITKSPEKSIEQAEQMAQKTIALTPDQPPPYNLLSFISRAKKDYDNTVLYAEKALESSPKDTSGYYVLGSALLSAGRYEEAIVKLETALRLVPVPPLTYVNNLAWSYLGSKQYDKAILLWTQTLERNPDYIFAFVGLAAAYELSGTKEKARWAAENVMRVSPEFSIAAWQEMFSLKDEAFWRRFSDACRSAGLK
jgi:adenylate cyclase